LQHHEYLRIEYLTPFILHTPADQTRIPLSVQAPLLHVQTRRLQEDSSTPARAIRNPSNKNQKWVNKNDTSGHDRSFDFIFRDRPKWIDSDNNILFLKVFHGKAAWKSVLKNENRDFITQTLELFSKPNIYYQIKIGFSSLRVSKNHLIQQ
jgi:hypothetical protein